MSVNNRNEKLLVDHSNVTYILYCVDYKGTGPTLGMPFAEV